MRLTESLLEHTTPMKEGPRMTIATPPVQSHPRLPQVLPNNLGVTARLAVGVHANAAAKKLNHNHIGTEHALLGLLADLTGVPTRTVVTLGRSTKQVHDMVEDVVGKPQLGVRELDNLRAHTENFDELMRRCGILGQAEVEPVDVLVEIARFEGCGAYQVLVGLGLDPRYIEVAAPRIAANPRTTSPSSDPLGT